jgi:hypothetical protein
MPICCVDSSSAAVNGKVTMRPIYPGERTASWGMGPDFKLLSAFFRSYLFGNQLPGATAELGAELCDRQRATCQLAEQPTGKKGARIAPDAPLSQR